LEWELRHRHSARCQEEQAVRVLQPEAESPYWAGQPQVQNTPVARERCRQGLPVELVQAAEPGQGLESGNCRKPAGREPEYNRRVRTPQAHDNCSQSKPADCTTARDNRC